MSYEAPALGPGGSPAAASPSSDDRRYLQLLAKSFPDRQSVYTEIINLEAICNLPAPTEHFMSDVHGEYEAFAHILNNCSGAIRERVAELFADELDAGAQADLCTLIYYPREKLSLLQGEGAIDTPWYRATLMRLVRLARRLSDYYTRSKVRKAMPVEYAYIIDELLHTSSDDGVRRQEYHEQIIESIIETGAADDFIESLASLIKRLAVDRLHLVGDIFDRGPQPDRILDRLMEYHSLDIEWGNHDIAWMGAAAGSALCQASVVRTCVHYRTLDVLESAYGISLRELARFAETTYTTYDNVAPLDKAIAVILFKLEGQAIARHDEWRTTAKRRLLHAVDVTHGTVTIDGNAYSLRTRDFPPLAPAAPYALSSEERRIVDGIAHAFAESDRLHRHVDFLYKKGSLYRIHDGNLLFHGCIPLTPDGGFADVPCGDHVLRHGRAYLDYCDAIARRAWNSGDQSALDWMYYLWCGAHSPLSGRVVKTFERTYVEDESTWAEPRDPYYALGNDPAVCTRILCEFGLDPEHGHIVNGHTPVIAQAGQSPVRAGGRMLVIDGGFAEPYHKKTGIAGYTLVTSSQHLRIKAHRPWRDLATALDTNADIMSETDVLERYHEPRRVGDTDTGAEIREQLADLHDLLDAYRSGALAEHGA